MSCSGRASARSPMPSRTRSWSATRSCPAFPGRASRATPAGPCSVRSAACRSRCSRAGRICTRAGIPRRSALPVRALRAAGASILVLTNAAGSLRPEVGPGSLMAITDHINMTGANLLAGPNDEAIGPRFPSLRDAYDPGLLEAPSRVGTGARDRARRGRLPGGQRAELRDAGGDPRVPGSRGGRGRHVDGPGDDPRPPLRPARRRRVGDHEPRRGHDRRAALPRADAARGGGRRRRPGAAAAGLHPRDADGGADPAKARRRLVVRR